MTARTGEAPGRGSEGDGPPDLGFDSRGRRRAGEIDLDNRILGTTIADMTAEDWAAAERMVRQFCGARRRPSMSRAAGYEWRAFLLGAEELDTEAHLYRRAQLAEGVEWPPMLRPWCEEHRPEPRRHERGSLSANRIAAPPASVRCPICNGLLLAANAEARSGQA